VLERTLRSLEQLLVCYPQAASLVVRMLVREGRAFARDPEGGQMALELSTSDWIERGRILWEACGLDELLQDPPGAGPEDGEVLPSAWIRMLFDELARANLEETLASLMMSGVPTSHDKSSQSNPGI
jgi:hypothetical protein